MDEKLIELLMEKAKKLRFYMKKETAILVLERLGEVDADYLNSEENEVILSKTIQDVLFEKTEEEFSNDKYDDIVDEFENDEIDDYSDMEAVLSVFETKNKRSTKNIEEMADDILTNTDNYKLDDIINEFEDNETDENMDDVMFYYVYSMVKFYHNKIFNCDGDLQEIAETIFESLKAMNKKLYLELYKDIRFKNFSRVKNEDFNNFVLEVINYPLFLTYHGLSFTDDFLKIKSYIVNIIKNNFYYDNLRNKVKFIEDVSYKLTMKLMINGYNYNDIVSKKYDKEIKNNLKMDSSLVGIEDEKIFSIYRIKESIKKEAEDFKEKVLDIVIHPIKRRIAIVLILTLLVSQFFPTFNEIKPRKRDSDIDSGIGTFDTYDYPKITSVDDKDYSLAIDHIRIQYPKYLKLNYTNTNYEQLCLYDTYQSISNSNRMNIMNSILGYFGSYYQISGVEEFESLSGYNTYYRYMYVMLVQANYGNIDASKYGEAILRYEASTFGRGESELTAQDKKLLNKLEKIYEKYIEEVRKDLEEKKNYGRGK